MEAEFRKRIQQVFDSIEKAFESIDPDLAEVEQSLGSMTILLSDQTRCILSSQPSVEQLWLAIAAKGTAYHFEFSPQKSKWFDTKKPQIELTQFLKEFFKEAIGIDVQI